MKIWSHYNVSEGEGFKITQEEDRKFFLSFFSFLSFFLSFLEEAQV